jgi:putative SOS response-associated peptidase YedK
MHRPGERFLRADRPQELPPARYFTSLSGEPLAFAGLWDERRNPETKVKVRSCTIVVTDANLFMKDYHDRMPVVLTERDFDAWLTGDAGVAKACAWRRIAGLEGVEARQPRA